MFKALQAASVGIPLGPFVDSAGTPNSGLTITKASVWVSKNNSIFALKSHSAACAADSLATGIYQCWLDGTDTATAGTMRVYCNYSGVLPVWEDGEIVTSLDMYTHVAANRTSLVSIVTSLQSIAANALSAVSSASLALTAYDGPTDAEMDLAVTSLVATLAIHTTSLVSIAANALSAVSSASLALTAYDPPTDAEMLAVVRAHSASLALTAYDPPTDAEMLTVVRAHSASLALTAYDALTKTQGNALAASLALAAWTSLTSIATSLASIATPVWAALRADHTVTNSFGQLVAGGIPKNVAFSNLPFLMVDETDHRTPKTGLTCGGFVSKDAGSFASIAGTITEMANGWYQADLAQADMNGTTLTFRFTGSGADDTGITIKTSS